MRFALGDAASRELTPGWADLVVSRFGVMFFADPARAFANLRQGLRQAAASRSRAGTRQNSILG